MSTQYPWRVKVNIHHLNHHCTCVFEIKGQGLRRQLRLGKKQVWAFSPCFENACCEAVTHFCFTDNQRGQGQRGVGMQTVWGWEIFGRNMGRNIGPWFDARNSAYLEVGWVSWVEIMYPRILQHTPHQTFTKPSDTYHIQWLCWTSGVVNVHCGISCVVNFLLFKGCGGYCNLLYGVLNVLFCIGYGRCLVWWKTVW